MKFYLLSAINKDELIVIGFSIGELLFGIIIRIDDDV